MLPPTCASDDLDAASVIRHTNTHFRADTRISTTRLNMVGRTVSRELDDCRLSGGHLAVCDASLTDVHRAFRQLPGVQHLSSICGRPVPAARTAHHTYDGRLELGFDVAFAFH